MLNFDYVDYHHLQLGDLTPFTSSLGLYCLTWVCVWFQLKSFMLVFNS